ncbi:MAG: hypothetical protein RI897_868 [Verrucomicrobiota bacterium]|jgi:hypothetical protein
MQKPFEPQRSKWFRPVTLWIPRWPLTLALLSAIASLTLLTLKYLHHFLSLTQPVHANVLVIEGWSPDYAMSSAITEFNRGQYDLLIASGGPLDQGSLITGADTYAELAYKSLLELGMNSNSLASAPAPNVLRNRTFVSATSVQDLLTQSHIHPAGINVISVGPHARRSYAVYQKVLAPHCPVGIISLPPQSYDPEHWWKSSDGIKTTISETAGWLYEACLNGGR